MSVIYKYRNWNDKYHKDVLLESKIYFAPPSSFNDPFDCKIPENFYLIDSEDKREAFANYYVNKHKSKLIQMGKNPAKIKQNLKNRLRDNLQGEHLFNEQYENQELDRCYGVWSGSKRWDSILMWSHYGDNHKGYCIGFDEKKLIDSKRFGRGGKVAYSRNFPIRNPLDFSNDALKDSFVQMFVKAEEWSYEKEYRLSILNPDGLRNENRIIELDIDFISEVVLGVCISDKSKAEIIEFCKAKNIRLFQAKKIPFQFELERQVVENN